MNTPQINVNDIVKALEDKGESKDYIIGFLSATLACVKHITDIETFDKYLVDTLRHAKA